MHPGIVKNVPNVITDLIYAKNSGRIDRRLSRGIGKRLGSNRKPGKKRCGNAKNFKKIKFHNFPNIKKSISKHH